MKRGGGCIVLCRDVDATSVGMSVAGDGAHMQRSAGDDGRAACSR